MKPRTLPNGKTYCGEEASTEDEQDSCIGHLEDGLFVSNRDKARALDTLRTGIARIKLAMEPCGFFGRFFRLSRCEVAK